MSDEYTNRERPVGEPDSELTTADLAGTTQTTSRPPIVETPAQTDSHAPDGARVPIATERTRVGSHAATAAAPAPVADREAGPLFSGSEANELRARWDAIQVGFVDEPRQAVEQADKLVAGTMKRLAEVFAEERSKLEAQWDQGENVSTEDLRQGLRRYRSFFSRLLSF